MAAAAILAAPVAAKGVEVVKEVQKDLFAALGRPLLSIESTESRVRKGKVRTTTTKGEINLFAIGAAAVGIGMTMWILGLGLVPKDTTRTQVIHHPAVWESFGGSYQQTSAAYDETIQIPMTTVTIGERPRMLLPFTSATGGSSTGVGGSPWSFWSGFIGPLLGLP